MAVSRGGEMKKVLGTVLTLVLGVALIAAVGLGFHSQKYEAVAGVTKAVNTGQTEIVNGHAVPVYALAINSFPDSSGMFSGKTPIHKGGNPSWPSYGPSNEFQIPSGVLVKVTWHQWDSGGSLNNPFFAYPKGIVGPMLVDGKPQASIDQAHVGHTFTMRAEPGVNSNFYMSVASPANVSPSVANFQAMASSPTKPGGQLVQFSFLSPKKGIYIWNCEYPCGLSIGNFGAVMSSYGYMSGYVHVV
jgi:hypothetical protein